ncbi:MAG: glycosyltransferase involved in cell wall biosynthesis [Rhodothermales bacterium]|jgi:glycosyltransferase involved in cell wall biosynthesis
MAGDVHRNARALRQLGALSNAGLSVTVVCLPGTDLESALPAGVSFVPVVVTGSGGPRFFWALHKAFSQALSRIPARLYHASDLYVLPAIHAAAGTTPYTYDARELYTHVSATVGRPHVRWLWGLVERRHIRHAAQVWTVSNSIADHLERAYKVPRPRVQFNAPVFKPVAPTSRLRSSLGLGKDTPVIIHVGQLRKDRGAEELIGAMALWRPSDPSDTRLVFLGYGPERARLEANVKVQGIQNRVHFVDAVPPAELLGAVAEADVGVTLLQPTCLNHRYALPNKLFDYLAAGLPVVASDLIETRKIISDYACGWTVDPSSKIAIRDTLSAAVSHRHEALRCNATAAAETLDWNKTSPAFAARLTELIAGS